MKLIELIFFRAGTFYSMACPARDEQTPADAAKENALCNPGTLRVEDIHRNVLWKAETN